MQERIGRSGTYVTSRMDLNRSHRLIVRILAFGCLLLWAIWFIFVSKYWSVREFDISGLQAISREEVASSTFYLLDTSGWKPWDQRNIFFVDTQKLSEDLRATLFLEHVTVDKTYPDVLRLLITERQRSVVLASKDQLLEVDSYGLVTQDVQGANAEQSQALLTRKRLADEKLPPVIVCDLPEPATSGYQVTTPETIHRWLDTYKKLLEAGIGFRYFQLSAPASSELSVVTPSGYRLIIDLDTALEPQLQSFDKFMQTQPKNFSVGEYIDIRIPGKIFLK